MLLYTNGPLVIGETTLGGNTNIHSALAAQIKGEPTSGEIYSRILALYGQKPMAGFTTQSIHEALALVGPLGADLAANNLTMYGSKRVPSGTIASGSDHASLAMNLGLIYPKQLSVAHQGDAAISYEVMPVSVDGLVHPFAFSAGVPLPTEAGNSRWTIESMEAFGTVIPQIHNVTLDFGLNVVSEGENSNVLDEIVSIRSAMPRLSVTSSDAEQMMEFMGGTGSFALTLRQRAQGGSFTGVTLVISGTDFSAQQTPFQAGNGATATTSFEVHPLWDGDPTHALLTVTYND